MAQQHVAEQRRLRLIAGAAIILGLSAIIFLAISVLRQVNALDQNAFDSAQWSLSQTEVEFLEYARAVDSATPEVDTIRLRFDIFYSRVITLKNARVFAPLRDDADFASELAQVDLFLDQSTPLIDGPDTQLIEELAALNTFISEARGSVRQLSLSGLDRYTRFLDQQKLQVSLTTAQLVAVIVALFAGLAIALLQMDRLNNQAAEREAALQQSNSRLNTVIGTALDGVLVTDADMQIIDFSPAAADIFQCSPEIAMGRHFFDFCSVGPPTNDEVAKSDALQTILEAKGRMKGTGFTLEGRSFPIEFAFQSAKTPTGDIHIAFVRDISAREAAEEELVAARDAALASERLKSDFLATMSHEIRTPLNGLIGNMDLLGDTGLSPHQARYLDNMSASGRMLMQHVSDVLDITQYDAGKLTVSPVVTNLSALIEDVVLTQRGLAEAHETSLCWHWEGPPLEWVSVDASRLQLILMNLVGNAVKFTRAGRVTVTATHENADGADHVRFEIADTGPGIDPEQLPHVFDDFFTGDASESRDVDGSGLGLGIARRFATALGGQIGIDSELGSGSTFSVTIPVDIAEAPSGVTPPDDTPVAPPQHVLVVEDNAINRTVVRDMLMADGHRVTEAVDGKTGLAIAQATQFDLILMDISMPQLDGREAAQRIVSGDGASRNAPIVALTANVFVSDAPGFQACGIVATVVKPLRRDALRGALLDVALPPTISGPSILADHLSETCETLGPAFEATMKRFSNEVDVFIKQFTAMPRAPFEEIADAAHKVAGSCALFGVWRLQQALLMVEETARERNGIGLHHLRQQLPELWNQAQHALQAHASTLTAESTSIET